MNKLIKQDINFMEYNLWMQDKEISNEGKGHIWKDRQGYVYRTTYKPPVKTDFVFLLSLLLQSQEEGWKQEITSTRYEVLRRCGIKRGKDWYKRLEDSLKRWSLLKLEFQGTFYDGKEYQTLIFGIIETCKIDKKSKKLYIRFSPEWLLRIKNSNYFKYINFNQVKALRSPLPIRLYEILIKTFQGRNTWKIDAMKLALKIPMNEKYVAHIIPKIKAAINRINEHTDLKIKLSVIRQKRGKAQFLFEKLDSIKPETLAPTAGLPEDEAFKELTVLLPEQERSKKTILETLSKAYRKHGSQYVARNIKYTNKHCEKNYRAYIAKALKADWGKGLEEEEEAERKAREEAIRKAKEEAERKRREKETLKKQRELEKRAVEYMKTLSEEALQELREAAIEKLDPNTQKRARAGDSLADIFVRVQMKAIASQRVSEMEGFNET